MANNAANKFPNRTQEDVKVVSGNTKNPNATRPTNTHKKPLKGVSRTGLDGTS
jgi:hypothetical protein